AGGASSPSCLQGLGIPYVTLYYAFLNNTGDPCQLYSLPLMTSSIYAQRYIEAVHAMLAALAKIPVASGGTLASRVAGVTVAAYIVLTSEMRIPGMGCSVGDVNQTAAQQAALWATAGYTSADALSIYQTIIRGIASDEALPNDAVLLQNVMRGEKESFPQPVGATPVLQPLLAASNAALGTRFVVSWNMVSEFGALPPRDVITAASAGTPLALQFNATAQGVTSCRGKLPNGHLDPIPATPACFQAMQPRNTAVIPQQSYLALWQVPPADFSVPGYFAN
ncbi:MAG TPA: hypothetical protein VMB71_04475, partial [Acetobacteraceae bacterium]|nr:hypothetical protein [Acetobacteraceae bacterium]